eukprot:tig00021365_g20828.t1
MAFSVLPVASVAPLAAALPRTADVRPHLLSASSAGTLKPRRPFASAISPRAFFGGDAVCFRPAKSAGPARGRQFDVGATVDVRAVSTPAPTPGPLGGGGAVGSPQSWSTSAERRMALGGLIGLLGGCAGALVGLGGAFLMVPLLAAWARLSQHEAQGTALLAVTFTGLVGAYSYGLRGAVDPLVAAILAASGLYFSCLGAAATQRVDPGAMKRCFGGFLLFSALSIPLKWYISTLRSSAPAFSVETAGRAAGAVLRELLQRWPAVLTIAIMGALSGFSSGFLGVSMGTLAVPALVVFSGLPQQLAQGTSLLAMIVPSIAGSYTHLQLHHVRFDVAPALVGGVILGAALGSRLACILPELVRGFDPAPREALERSDPPNARSYLKARGARPPALKGVFTAMLSYFGLRDLLARRGSGSRPGPGPEPRREH